MFQENRVVEFEYHGKPRRLQITAVKPQWIGGFEELEGVYKNFRLDDETFVIGQKMTVEVGTITR